MVVTAVIVVIMMKFILGRQTATAFVMMKMPKGFCCFMCGHCDDEVIAEMSGCKCKCHRYG
jgi:hypothetical protein